MSKYFLYNQYSHRKGLTLSLTATMNKESLLKHEEKTSQLVAEVCWSLSTFLIAFKQTWLSKGKVAGDD